MDYNNDITEQNHVCNKCQCDTKNHNYCDECEDKSLTVTELIKELKKLNQDKQIFLSGDEEGNDFSTLGGGHFLQMHTIQETDKGNYILFPLKRVDEDRI